MYSDNWLAIPSNKSCEKRVNLKPLDLDHISKKEIFSPIATRGRLSEKKGMATNIHIILPIINGIEIIDNVEFSKNDKKIDNNNGIKVINPNRIEYTA